MSFLKTLSHVSSGLGLFGAGVLLAFAIVLSSNPLAAQSPMLQENMVKRVSDHVYVIMGFPNIGFVVGSRGTLVVDTGLGARNGALVAREAQKLAKGPNLYLTTTHFHPEHAGGDGGFPARTVLIRPSVQQEEMNKYDSKYLDMFRNMSAENKELLQNVKHHTPDILFDNDMKLDLGGVTARIFWLGAAHTAGDELIFVEEDKTLISGDIVQNKLVPYIPDEGASIKSWLTILDKLEPLKPRFILPDHGELGDGSLIGLQRTFLMDLQKRTLELKQQGKSVDEASQIVGTEFKTKYSDWTGLTLIPRVVRLIYAESK